MNFAMFDMNPMVMGKEITTDLFKKKSWENSSCPGDFLSRFEKAMKDHSLGSVNHGTDMGNIQEDSLGKKIDELMSTAKNPMEFVQVLEQIMAFISGMSGGNLQNLKIDPQGLAILKEILAGAGFDPDEVDQSFLQLSQTLDTKDLPADKLLEALFTLASETDTPMQEQDFLEQDLVFPESMIPVIQSILYHLGLEKDTADHIMASAIIKGRGVRLNKLIEQLKTLDGQNPWKSFQSPEGDKSFVLLFEQMGLPVETGKGTFSHDVSLTLNRLIHSLEALRDMVMKTHNDLVDTKGLADAKLVQQEMGKFENPLSQALKEIFSMSAQADSATVLTDPGKASGQQKGQKISSSYHHIKAMTDQMQSLEEAESFDKKIQTTSRKDLFNALAEHMKVEENESRAGMEASSEGLKKHQNKIFSMDASRGEALQKNDSVMALDQGSGAEGQKGKFSMEDMLSRKISLPETKNRERNFSRDGDGIEVAPRKTLTANSIKNPEIPSRPLPVHVTRQVGKGVLKAIQQGENTLRLQLKPASMGRLLITIDNLGASMKVSIMTENQAAKDMLNANVNELKGILANTGINLADFHVDMGSDFGQSMANTQQGSGGAGKRGNRSGAGGIDSNGDGDSLVTSESDGSGAEETNGSLHYVA